MVNKDVYKIRVGPETAGHLAKRGPAQMFALQWRNYRSTAQTRCLKIFCQRETVACFLSFYFRRTRTQHRSFNPSYLAYIDQIRL